MQELHINVQDQTDSFYFESTENTAFTLRVYIYETLNGVVTPKALTAYNTAKFYYYVNEDSTEVVSVTGTCTTGAVYIDFPFTVAKTAINGRFGASIIIFDTALDPENYSNGQIKLERNPATGSNTELDTWIVVNWSNVENVGNVPWAMSQNITEIECADSPYYIQTSESGDTFLLNSNCDIILILPQATTANIGKTYSFLNKKKAYTITIQCRDGDSIDDSPVTGAKYTVRNYSIPSKVTIQQDTATTYSTVFGDGAWDTKAGVVDFSSSSSE